MPPLPADFIHARACKLKCEKILTRPFRSIIEQINSKFFIITFPTKSISGKNVGMKDYYENMMTKYIENSQMEIIFRKAYFNEIMFVIKK